MISHFGLKHQPNENVFWCTCETAMSRSYKAKRRDARPLATTKIMFLYTGALLLRSVFTMFPYGVSRCRNQMRAFKQKRYCVGLCSLKKRSKGTILCVVYRYNWLMVIISPISPISWGMFTCSRCIKTKCCCWRMDVHPTHVASAVLSLWSSPGSAVFLSTCSSNPSPSHTCKDSKDQSTASLPRNTCFKALLRLKSRSDDSACLSLSRSTTHTYAPVCLHPRTIYRHTHIRFLTLVKIYQHLQSLKSQRERNEGWMTYLDKWHVSAVLKGLAHHLFKIMSSFLDHKKMRFSIHLK